MTGKDPDDPERGDEEHFDRIVDPTSTVPGVSFRDLLGDDLDVLTKALTRDDDADWRSVAKDTPDPEDRRREWDDASGSWRAASARIPDPTAFTAKMQTQERPEDEDTPTFGFAANEGEPAFGSATPTPERVPKPPKGILAKFLAIFGL